MLLTKFVHLTLFLFIYNIAVESCNIATFKNTVIKIKNVATHFQLLLPIDGCLSQQKIIEKVLLGTEKITYVDCFNQSVQTLYENAVTSLPDVVSITFSYSGIKQVKRNAFANLPKLSSLDLSYNDIDAIEAFANLPITSLLLANNKIEFLENRVFANLPNLKAIALNYNRLTHFDPQWFGRDSGLTAIEATNNIISALQKDTFTSFKSLQSIDLRHNRIRHVHKEAFDGLENITSLDLSSNRIRKLEQDVFKSLHKVKELWLYGNNITYISDKTLRDISSVESITIHTNPWQCACYDRILKWALEHPVYIVAGIECINENNPVCITPSVNEAQCLEEREEDLNRMYYEQYTNDECEDE